MGVLKVEVAPGDWRKVGCDSPRTGGDYPAAVLADSPVAYWKLDETSGTSAADSSGNGHTATYTDAGMVGAVDAPVGLGGVAPLFAHDDYVISASDAAFSLTTFTLEAIARLDSGGQSTLISHDSITTGAETNSTYNLYLETNGATAEANNVSPFINGGPGCTFTGRWVHVMLTHDPGRTGRTRLFLNGVLVATANVPAFETGVRPLLLGRRGFTPAEEPLNGPMCHVAIYPTALADAAAAAHFAETGLPANLCPAPGRLRIELPDGSWIREACVDDTSTPAGTVTFSNGGAESGMTGWLDHGNGTELVQDTTALAYAGSSSFELLPYNFGVVSSSMQTDQGGGSGPYAPYFACSPGGFRVSARLTTPGFTARGYALLRFVGSGGTLLSTATILTAADAVTGTGWTLLTGEVVAPAGTVGAVLEVGIDSPNVPGAANPSFPLDNSTPIYIDEISFVGAVVGGPHPLKIEDPANPGSWIPVASMVPV